jgi:hypothetical protein
MYDVYQVCILQLKYLYNNVVIVKVKAIISTENSVEKQLQPVVNIFDT